MRATALTLLAAGALLGADVTLPVEKYKLPNGMRVVLSQDNAVPVVAVYVIYGVGARAEEKGRTGFAHLFEHMMFEGSANVPKGMHFQAVEANGGSAQRLHPPGLHGLLPDHALQQTGHRAVAGKRPHAQPGDQRREAQEPEGGGKAGAPPELRQPALQHRHRGPLAGAGLPQLAELPLPHRLVRGPQRPPPWKTCASSSAPITRPTTPCW